MGDFSAAGTGGTSGLGTAPPMSGAEKLAVERTQAEAAQRRQQAAETTAALAATPVQTGPTQEEKRARSEHLKLQRALLVEKKNRERQESLSAYQQTHGATTAARLAEKACARGEVVKQGPSEAGRLLAAELAGSPQNVYVGAPDPGAAAVEMRKALTRQLKQTLC